MKTSLYKGQVVEESLRNNRILNSLHITHVEITKDRNPRDRWHIYTVQMTKRDIDKLSKNLKGKHWYAHFYKGNELIVAFQNKIFRLKRSEPKTWKEAIEYGLKLGIPKKQLDFKIPSSID